MKIFYANDARVPFLTVWSIIQVYIMFYPGGLKFSGFYYRNGRFIQPEN